MLKSVITFFTFFIFPFYSIAQSHSGKYFEGYIEYAVSYQSFIPGVSDNEIRDRFGSKHRYYVKGNNYLREALDENDFSLSKGIYIGDEKRTYTISLSEPDSIYYTNVSDSNFLHFSITDGIKEKVLDCECPSVNTSIIYLSEYTGDTSEMILTYFFCEQLPVNPDWYKGYVYWHDIVSKYKSVAIKFEEEMSGLFKTTYTATSIHPGELKDEIFQFDRTKYMVKAKF